MDKVDSKEYDGSVKDSESVEIGVDFVDEISRQCHLQDHLKTNDLQPMKIQLLLILTKLYVVMQG